MKWDMQQRKKEFIKIRTIYILGKVYFSCYKDSIVLKRRQFCTHIYKHSYTMFSYPIIRMMQNIYTQQHFNICRKLKTHIHNFDRHSNWISAFRTERIRSHISYTTKQSFSFTNWSNISNTRCLAPAVLLLAVWRQMCKAEKM